MAADVTMADLAALSSESSFSGAPTDTSSNVASFSSTPPTTVSPDSMSLASDPDVPKQDTTAAPLLDVAIPLLDIEQQEPGQQTPVGNAIVVAEHSPEPAPGPFDRKRRSRASLPVYNLSQLSGTRASGGRRARDDASGDGRRRTTGDSNVNGVGGPADALGLDWSVSGPRTPRSTRTANTKASPASAQITRRATRLSGAQAETLAVKLATLGRRGRKSFEKRVSRMSRELRRLQDTDEFAHIETQPVRYTVWSNGKYVDVEEAQDEREPPRKKTKVDESTAGSVKKEEAQAGPESREPAAKKRRVKKWLDKGLYAGQEAPIDISKGMSAQEKKKLASIPELVPSGKANKTLPMPMFNGLRLLINGRDFKLPFDVCNPLPPGQPKPAAYRTMTKNRFVGDAAAYWKKTPHFEDFASKCVCKPEDGCAEDCQNRIMLYECDETNCNVGKEHCQNRAFQTLQERTKKGGRYRVGVEVVKTSDRGYGVRSNRCFEANQIIMEYTGEIITVEECDRRMNEEYKDNECYYLMSFDQNMIIDATTGSIARFVNHSCSPNCRMIKWIVSGQPRMALFAGDRPITTGEELTYDYNFDPFSAKNVQKCLCGSPNCRGVLGPKPKEVKPPKPPKEESKKKGSVKGPVNAGKRKLKELLSSERAEKDESNSAKKRKTQTAATATKVKAKGKVVKVPSKAGKGKAKVVRAATKGAATTIKQSVSSVSVKAKSALIKKTASGFVVSRGLRQTKISFKPTTARKSSASSTASSSLTTIVAKPAKPTPKRTADAPAAKGTPKSKTVTPSASASSARRRTPSWKALESAETSPVRASPVSVNSGKPMRSRNALEPRPSKVRLARSSIYDFPN